MNYTLSIITTVVLIFTCFREFRIWKLRALLSPALYFSISWAFGTLGLSILGPVGLIYDPHPKYIDELNILVLFTALCFCFWSKKGRNKIVEDDIKINYSLVSVYNVLSVLFFLAAIYEFISLGGNLNMAASRDAVHETSAQRSTIVNYASTLDFPLSIFAGYQIIKSIVKKEHFKFLRILFLILPLFGNLIFSINLGGRVNFVYCFITYLLGVALALTVNQSLKEYRKPMLIVSSAGIGVLLFISAVGNQRDEYKTGEKNLAEQYLSQKSPLLGAIYGPVSYMIASYNGYQLRRLDAVDINHLGFGMYTFNGFINWTLPFSSQFGLGDASIAKSLGIYYYNQETYDFHRELYYTTHSGYLTLIKDFGFWGTLICIFILTLVSHNLFVGIQTKKKIMYASSLWLYYLFWIYWVKMNFYGTLSNTVLIPLYGFLISDIANYLIAGKKTNKHVLNRN